MTNKKLSFICLFWLMVTHLFAQQLSQTEAKKIAGDFLGKGSSVSLDLVDRGGNAINPSFYIFNASQGNGFVIIAADKGVENLILAYSTTGHYDKDNVPAAFNSLLHTYSEKIQEIQEGNSPRKNLRNAQIATLTKTIQVGPLLGNIIWGQEAPFNNQCPLIGDRHAVTGCGATATAQVMKYFNWPDQGTGSHKNSSYGNTSIDYSKQTYNWDLLLPVYSNQSTEAQKNEVAKLMAHVGNALDMNYSTDGSGTSLYTIPKAFSQYFKYSDKTQVAYRLAYTDDEWFELIKREIELKRPVIYSGLSKDGGGHLFVCDGYDSDKKLHYNYGWNGYLNVWASDLGGSFPSQNSILTGILPNNITIPDTDLPAPQIAAVTPLNCSSYAFNLGTKINIGVRVANYNTLNFSGQLGIALYKNEQMVGSPLQTIQQTLKASSPNAITSSGIVETDIQFTNVLIPAGTTTGDYQLRVTAQQGGIWYPAGGVTDYVVKDLNIAIANGKASLSYPLTSTVCDLELVSPIDVSVANNQATARFLIRNAEELSTCENTNIYVVSTSEDKLIPEVWKGLKIEKLVAGQTQEFKISDVSIPSGNISKCRFYIAYNRAKALPIKNYEIIASTPMMPINNNFKSYQIPAESVMKMVDFKKEEIPADYMKYDADGQPVTTSWKGILSKATPRQKGAKLVTSAIDVSDENCVLEWQWRNMYSSNNIVYKVYISTQSQDISNFIQPIFEKTFDYGGIARLNLSEFAGQKIYIAFESPDNGEHSLMYYKLLNIRTPKDISLESILTKSSIKIGEELPVVIKVKNLSSANVKKITASYTFGSEPTVTEDIQTDISFNDIQEITFTKKITGKGKSGDIIPLNVSLKLDGEEVGQTANNEKSMEVMVVDFYPKKNLLLFKASKIGCPGCMMSYTQLSQFDQDYPDIAIPLELWRNGRFQTPGYERYTNGTTPTYFMDGKWTSHSDGLSNTIRETYSSMTAPANIQVEAGYKSTDSRILHVKVKSTFALPLNKTFRLGAIIIENNVVDFDRQAYGSAPVGELLVKDHILVGVQGGTDGATGKEVKNPEAKVYTYEFDYPLPDELINKDKPYRYQKDNIQVIGVLYGSNGEILNSSLDSYYLKLPETEGLTFEAVNPSSMFKRIYEVKNQENTNNLLSIATYRATLPTGSDFHFKVNKDNTWKGKKVKLTVNKNALLKDSEEEILTPDQEGVYTITDIQKHYYITIEAVEEEIPNLKFEVKHNGEVLSNGQVIEIREQDNYANEIHMKFQVDVTNISNSEYGMFMKKEVVNTMNHTSNSVCWDACMGPDDPYASSVQILPGQTQQPYADMQLNDGGLPVEGTSIIRYTFQTTTKGDPTLMVEVHYIYKELPTGIEPEITPDSLQVIPGHGSLTLISTVSRTIHLYKVNGILERSIDLPSGTTVVKGLSQGIYVINRKKVIVK